MTFPAFLRHPGRETFQFPLPAPARLAVIDAEFHWKGEMTHLTSGDMNGLIKYAPEALLLPLSSALQLADQKLQGLCHLPGLKCAVIVLSSLDDPTYSHHRDLLWRAFGLPVFEQMRDWNGRVFARECEVHDGLHFDNGIALAESGNRELIVMGKPTGIPAEIIVEACECGKETPRLRCLAVPKARAAAA